MANSTALIVIVAVVVVVLLFSSQIIAAVPNIQSLIQNLLGFGTGSANGNAALGFTIYFTDGTKQEINQSTLSLLPLSILFQGKFVSSIETDVKAKVTPNGDVSAWSSATTLNIVLTKKAGINEGFVVPLSYTIGDTGSSWDNGTVKTVATKTLTQNEIELRIASQELVPWSFQAAAAVTLNITSNGIVTGLKASVSGGFNILYAKGTLTVDGVDIQPPAPFTNYTLVEVYRDFDIYMLPQVHYQAYGISGTVHAGQFTYPLVGTIAQCKELVDMFYSGGGEVG